ncbi:hypothetical protein [Natranaerobius trueperi]|uniref:Uncharacterized protein n=1 Tax=Natranaerobius trueperi TaxID=759412 RepID=A0A226BV17_9FIRM|nr:hypothetical protein [Natranaerobius trueperi]OWZ82721.1 hypothetical protein CDO51_12585 [Natranaerobius trueperi]
MKNPLLKYIIFLISIFPLMILVLLSMSLISDRDVLLSSEGQLGLVLFILLVLVLFMTYDFLRLILGKKEKVLKGVKGVLILFFVYGLLWLHGFSFNFGGIIPSDAEVIHTENLASDQVAVYEEEFIGEKAFETVRYSRPLGLFYMRVNNGLFTGFLSGKPVPITSNPDFIRRMETMDDEIFIFVKPFDDKIEYFLIGDFTEKHYTLEDAKQEAEHYILKRLNTKEYIVVVDKRENWKRSPGIIAFNEEKELVSGRLYESPYHKWPSYRWE